MHITLIKTSQVFDIKLDPDCSSATPFIPHQHIVLLSFLLRTIPRPRISKARLYQSCAAPLSALRLPVTPPTYKHREPPPATPSRDMYGTVAVAVPILAEGGDPPAPQEPKDGGTGKRDSDSTGSETRDPEPAESTDTEDK